MTSPPALSEPAWLPDVVKGDQDPENPGPVGLRLVNLPENFWASRRALAHIRQAAHARARSGDIMLGGTLARVSALMPPWLTADTGIGSPASLNLFVILLGPSGAGKSFAAQGPKQILPFLPRHVGDFLDDLPLGSGEGIAEAYMGEVEVETGEIWQSGKNKGDPKTKIERGQVRTNALFYADEGEALTKQLARNGSTVGETIRRAWTGGTLGQFNGQKVNTRVIPAGRYSLGLVVGFQPETAQPILEDAAAGTPQRFLWVSAIDPAIPVEVVEHPGPLALPLMRRGIGRDARITFAPEILREIRADDRARATGAVMPPPLDSHKPLMLVKVAVLLAVLDDRLHVTVEDWELSRIVWETSCGNRDALVAYGERQLAREAEKKTMAHVDREMRAHAAKAKADRAIERVARGAAKKVHETGGMTRAELNRAIAHRDRDRFAEALDHAEALGWVGVEGGRVVPGDSMPL